MPWKREDVQAVQEEDGPERMNSRAERLIGRNTLRVMGKVGGYVGVVLTLMRLIAAVSYRNGRPEPARSIEYYASH